MKEVIPNKKLLNEWGRLWRDMGEYEEPGYTYIIQCDDYYKIGHTTDLASRFSSLQVANVNPIRVVCFWISLCAEVLECELHVHFAHRKVRGEWFALTREEVNTVKQWAQARGIPTYLENDRNEREASLSPRSTYRRYNKENPNPEPLPPLDSYNLF